MSNGTSEQLRTFVSKELLVRDEVSSLKDDEDLLEQIDSMAIMELVSFIEDTFNVVLEYDDLDADNFRTLASIERLVKKKVGST